MEKTASNTHDNAVTRTAGTFNVYKLQAAACIITSAAVSIALIYLVIRAFA